MGRQCPRIGEPDKRAVILTEGQSITAAHMGLAAPAGSPEPEAMATLQEARDEAERKALSSALALSAGNLSAAAKILGVSRRPFTAC